MFGEIRCGGAGGFSAGGAAVGFGGLVDFFGEPG
jgi:hypothetical protein